MGTDRFVYELFTISSTGHVKDTGQQYYASNDSRAYFLKNTFNGNLAIVEYQDSSRDAGNFATAIINGDGSLTWTGYTFAFDYGAYVTDFVVVPVYVTGIPKELWKDPLPEMKIKSHESIYETPFH